MSAVLLALCTTSYRQSLSRPPPQTGTGAHNNAVQVCDTIAELASGTYEELGWPELLPFIFQCVQSNDARLQESALLIFAQLAHHIMGTLRQYMATLHEVLTRTLQSPNHDIALASMRATAAFVQVTKLPASPCLCATGYYPDA